MGMDSYVTFLRDLGGEFKKMMEIKKFCDKQKVSYPIEVQNYFGKLINESDAYIAEEMAQISAPREVVTHSTDDARDHYEIEVSRIPPGTKTIRFTNSY